MSATLTRGPGYFIPSCFPPRGKICSHKDLCLNVCSSFVCISGKLEIMQMSMDKDIVVYSHSGVLDRGQKAEQQIHTTNMNGLQRQYWKWSKPGTRALTGNSRKGKNYVDRKQMSVVARVWGWGGGWPQMGMSDLFGVMNIFLSWFLLVVIWLYTFVKYQIVRER